MYSIRDITKEIATAVIKEAIVEDLAEGYREMDARELRKLSKVYLRSTLLSNFLFLFVQCNCVHDWG